MFNGRESYKTPFKSLPKEPLKPKTETLEPVIYEEVEPPAAERMLRKMRSKITGKGLKEL